MDEKLKLKYFYYNRVVHLAYDLFNIVKKNIYFNSVPLYRNERYCPFFIVGSGRSGNTLLRRVLNAKEGIVIPPETYVLGNIIRLHNIHKNLEWDNYVNLIISTFEYHHQFFTFEIESLSELALELKQIEKNKRSLAYIINRFYTFYAQEKNMSISRWGDKTPLNSMYVYRLKHLFPHAQFIHIIRDGVDVVNSYVEAKLYDDYRTAALRWKKSVQFLQKFGRKYPADYLEIKYEEFVMEPQNTVEKACLFLDIPFTSEILSSAEKAESMGDVKYLDHHQNVSDKINTNSIGKGRREISNEILQGISPLINNTLEELGYKKVDND